jgi:hypothetical protein
LDDFSLREEGADISILWRGKLGVAVSITDVKTGDLLWPEGETAGMTVKPVETPTETHSSPNHGEELTAALAEAMADRVAKLFYEHDVTPEDEMGSEP